MQRNFLLAMLVLLLLRGAALAQITDMGQTPGGVHYGALTLHGQACTWRQNPLREVHYFSGAWWGNGTTCTALSNSGRFAAVEWSYRNGETWWCWAYQCELVPGGGVVDAIDNAGNMWGRNAAANSHAVLWLWWPTVRRYDFPQWYGLASWGEQPFHNGFLNDDWPVRHVVWIEQYDANCDGIVDNFDIDPFMDALVSGGPSCGAFFYTNFDLDPFVAQLLDGR